MAHPKFAVSMATIRPTNGFADCTRFFLSQWIDSWRSYQLSLFAADTLQAIGGVLNFKWVQDGTVKVGSYCDAQGGVHFWLL